MGTNTSATGAQLERASAVVERLLGLHFSASRFPDLGQGLARAAEDLQVGDPQSLEWLFRGELGARELAVLAQRLTIGETYFFRDDALFRALEHELLPRLIRERSAGCRRLCIWSAGCATGEEPYSVAMLLERLLPEPESWDVQLLATDLNAHSLQSAATGIYKEWSFREVPAAVKERFFAPLPNGRHALVDRIRTKVRFALLNLVEDAYPCAENGTSEVDLILCRNVLMYFRPERFIEVTSRLGRCLAKDGFLAVSPAEASWQLLEQFRPVQLGGAVLYQSRPKASLAPPIPTEPAMSERSPSAGPSVRSTQGPPGQAQALPSNQELNWKRALNHARLGQHEQAEAALVLLLKQAPTCAPALTLQAQLLASQGRLAEALVACDYALALERLSPVGHQLRASILEQLGRAEEAIQSLQRSLYLDPNYVLSHYTLGRIALRDGQLGYARKCFSDVLALLRRRPAEQELQEAHGLTCGALAHATQNLMAKLG